MISLMIGLDNGAKNKFKFIVQINNLLNKKWKFKSC